MSRPSKIRVLALIVAPPMTSCTFMSEARRTVMAFLLFARRRCLGLASRKLSPRLTSCAEHVERSGMDIAMHSSRTPALYECGRHPEAGTTPFSHQRAVINYSQAKNVAVAEADVRCSPCTNRFIRLENIQLGLGPIRYRPRLFNSSN